MSELHNSEYKTTINQDLSIGFNFSLSLKNGVMPDGLEEAFLKEKSDDIYEKALSLAKEEVVRFYPTNYEKGSGDFTIDYSMTEEEDGEQVENDYSVVVDFDYEVIEGYLGGRRFELTQEVNVDLEKEFTISANVVATIDDSESDEYIIDCEQAFDEALSDIKNNIDGNTLSGEEEVSIKGVTYNIDWSAD